jgi:hypothetical protein
VSEGGGKRHLREILVVAEIQTMSAVVSWRHWVEDFPLLRESVLI